MRKYQKSVLYSAFSSVSAASHLKIIKDCPHWRRIVISPTFNFARFSFLFPRGGYWNCSCRRIKIFLHQEQCISRICSSTICTGDLGERHMSTFSGRIMIDCRIHIGTGFPFCIAGKTVIFEFLQLHTLPTLDQFLKIKILHPGPNWLLRCATLD